MGEVSFSMTVTTLDNQVSGPFKVENDIIRREGKFSVFNLTAGGHFRILADRILSLRYVPIVDPVNKFGETFGSDAKLVWQTGQLVQPKAETLVEYLKEAWTIAEAEQQAKKARR